MTDVDWALVAKKLPWGKDKAAGIARKAMFRQFDPNGNGLLSLAEADKGLHIINMQDIIPKAVLMRAFQAAKDINSGGNKNEDFIDYKEFRMFLLYIRQYLELYVMFARIDTSGDKKIEKAEFAAAVDLCNSWGVEVKDPDATFKEIDVDGGGAILFDEFAHWAIKHKLDLEDDDDAADAGPGSGLISKSFLKKKKKGGPPEQASDIQKVDWARVAAKLPWGKDKESSKARKVLFRSFDPNGNGLLSLAEADKGIVVLGLDDVCSKAVIMRAYQASKGVNQTGKAGEYDDFIDKKEFRMFLLYIRQYLELWVMFDAIDTSKDRRIEEAEFAAAVDLVGKWGLKIDDASATFKEIDADGGGIILFDEFADWAIKHKLDLEDDDDAEDAGAGSGLIAAGLGKKKKKKKTKGAANAEPEQVKIDWGMVATKLPWKKDKESSTKRRIMFRQFDPNGNGLLSLAEIDKGIVTIGLDDVCSKAVIMRAYQAAKGINQSGKAGDYDDFVDYKEFRMFLLYIRQYLELWVMFDAIDTSKDRRIEAAEFAGAVELVGRWGLKIDDADATFKEIDADGGGIVLFDEFADWAIKHKLDLEDDDDAEDAGAGSGLIAKGGVKKGKKKGSKKKGAKKKAPEKKNVDWAAVAKKMPWGKDAEATKRRKMLFRQFDPNGNGLLSLAETDLGVVAILNLGDVCSKACIIRAFNAAKGLNTKGKAGEYDDFVDKNEFRMLLLYLRQYLELWVMFDAIDHSKDGRIEEDEFKNAVSLIKKWGLTVEDPSATFQEIDADGGGVILFDEFADWAIRHKLDLDDDDDAEDAGAGSGLIKKGGVAKKKKKKAAPKKLPEKKQVNWGEVAAKLPWGKDAAASKKRKELFKSFDPNGNGLMSLAEADKGVVEVLDMGDVCSKAVIMRAYQASKGVNKGPGKSQNDDFIDYKEFRLFLLYLRQYLELWVMFDAIDTSKDRRIEEDEFKASVELVAKWGLKIDDPVATFNEIDADEGGVILFDEFADWAIKHKLDLEDDDDAEDAGAGSGLIAPGRKAIKKPASRISSRKKTSSPAKKGSRKKDDSSAKKPAGGRATGAKPNAKVKIGFKFTTPANAKGLTVTSVAPGSAAANAGIVKGDIVQMMNRKPVPSKDAFISVLNGLKPGTVLKVNLIRNSERMDVKVQL